MRMRWHEPTIACIQRRTAEGLSKREIIRCLNRYLAREVYTLLPATTTATYGSPQARLANYRSINAVARRGSPA